MTKQPSPRLDALRAMREATYDRAMASRRELERASEVLAKRKKEDALRDLQELAAQAGVPKRRKGKKAKRKTGG
jgi:hypothetical protein